MKYTKDQLDAFRKILASAQVDDDDLPFQLHPAQRAVFSKGRQMGKTQAMRDRIRAEDVRGRRLTQSDVFNKTCAECGFMAGVSTNCNTCELIRLALPPTSNYYDANYDPDLSAMPMPTVYPTLKRRGLIVEMELPAMPTAVGYKLVTDLVAASGGTLRKTTDDFHGEFAYRYFDQVKRVLEERFGKVEWSKADNDPDPSITPIEIFCEYVGQCRSHADGKQQKSIMCPDCNGRRLPPGSNPMSFFGGCSRCNGQGRIVTTSNLAYASGWWNDGWNVRFLESVLRSYFGEPEAAFNGDFFSYLLSSRDLSKSYRQLARKYHPDLGGNVKEFLKLKDAYDVLKDPLKRKRYQAGLAFQEKAQAKTNEVVFRVPRSCGRVTLKGVWEAVEPPIWGQRPRSMFSGGRWDTIDEDVSVGTKKRLNVTEIISWNEIVNDKGQVMVATWAGGTGSFDRANRRREQRGEKPFSVGWEDKYELEFDVKV